MLAIFFGSFTSWPLNLMSSFFHSFVWWCSTAFQWSDAYCVPRTLSTNLFCVFVTRIEFGRSFLWLQFHLLMCHVAGSTPPPFWFLSFQMALYPSKVIWDSWGILVSCRRAMSILFSFWMIDYFSFFFLIPLFSWRIFNVVKEDLVGLSSHFKQNHDRVSSLICPTQL